MLAFRVSVWEGIRLYEDTEKEDSTRLRISALLSSGPNFWNIY